jgi:sulfoxide reductase heme-binding subunit YedZ
MGLGRGSWRDRAIYAAVWLALLAPMLLLVWGALTDDLGANPVERLIRQLGVWGLRFLILGLAITPAARLLRRPRLIRYRRTVGLFAFSYIVLHLLSYAVIDHRLDWATIGKDIAKRPYITIGMAAFTLLIPLAVTSTDWMLRKLGPLRWRRLHSLIYLIVPMGVVHYFLLVKADRVSPVIYGSIVAVLLAWRAWEGRRKSKAKPHRKPVEKPAVRG